MFVRSNCEDDNNQRWLEEGDALHVVGEIPWRQNMQANNIYDTFLLTNVTDNQEPSLCNFSICRLSCSNLVKCSEQ